MNPTVDSGNQVNKMKDPNAINRFVVDVLVMFFFFETHLKSICCRWSLCWDVLCLSFFVLDSKIFGFGKADLNGMISFGKLKLNVNTRTLESAFVVLLALAR